jgi:hypothetical protein
MNNIDRTWEAAIAVSLAAAGGIARLLSVKGTKKLRWSCVLAELFISGFTGLMVLMVARASGVSGDWIGVLAGMSGWVGPRILDAVTKAAHRATGIDVSSEGEEKKSSK